MAKQTYKYLIVVNLRGSLGGAEIRYLNLFGEISIRKNDYYLIINRKLFDIAVEVGYLNKSNNKVIILEIDKHPPFKPTKKQTQSIKKIRSWYSLKKIRKTRNSLLSIKKLLLYTYKLHQVFKNNKPEYVYAVWIGGMITWPLKYFYKFKFVYSYMDSGFSSLGSFLNQPLKSERMPLKHADTVDFLSADLYRGIHTRMKLNKKTKISLTPCSFKNYENIQSAEKKINTITFCSRMTEIKNPLLLLESIVLFNKTCENWKDITFQFLGNGDCFNKMKDFKQLLNLSNVELLGHVNKPIEYLSKSKIFISIQQTNNYPSQSLLEAMSCENAIIASDVGETKKLVTIKEGILVSLEAEKIAKAMIFLFENEEKRRQYGKQAREKVLREHNIDRYLKHFYSLENL